MAYYWIDSRYESKCSECECDILPGDKILYSPNDKGRADVYCRPCGEDVDQREDFEVES